MRTAHPITHPGRYFGYLSSRFTRKYLLCNQGVRRIWLPPEQKVGGSNPLGRTNSFIISNLRGLNFSVLALIFCRAGKRSMFEWPLAYKFRASSFKISPISLAISAIHRPPPPIPDLANAPKARGSTLELERRAGRDDTSPPVRWKPWLWSVPKPRAFSRSAD